MATIDVSKVGNPIAALKKLKRTLERQGSPKFSDRNEKPSIKARRRKLAAIKREKKKQFNSAKGFLTTTRRYRNLSLKQVVEKLYG